MPVPVAKPAPGLPHADAVTRVRQKFDEAVRIRMIADVPLGAFLSGGIDSSSVVASMALQSPEPIKTFSIGFEESRFNELPYARMVAEKYAIEHHEIVVRPDSIAIIRKFTKHFGEPASLIDDGPFRRNLRRRHRDQAEVGLLRREMH